MKNKTLVVIGGGAAGFFTAINAARMQPALQVIILEKTSKLLSKVRISGGGRCNVTHACFDIPAMVRHYPRGANFLKKAFHHFFTTDTIEWFKQRGVELKQEADGRMFPVTDSSETIIRCLVSEANKYNVEIRLQSEVLKIDNSENNGPITLHLSGSRVQTADYVCIACGGYPKDAMFEWIKGTGHTIEAPLPSLFTFNMPGNPVTQLMGVAVPDTAVKVMGSKLSARGPLLITHWGMSGPAVLRLSAWGARELAAGRESGKGWHFTILINWLPEYNEQTLQESFRQYRIELASQKIGNRNPFGLPQRLWQFMLAESGIREDSRWADLPAREQNRLIKNCCNNEFEVKGKTTFKEEFVTAGGIKLSEVDANTMQSKLVPGLYFAGEILDVDGITGGFNFQHAWTSGFIAAKAIAAKAGEE